MRRALLWEPEDGSVRCGICPHRCLIAEGSVGFCSVRENVDGVLVPLTYGRVASVAVDPIEKKPVFHFCPGVDVLSLGSVGCSMRCRHCQNWSISRATPTDAEVRLSELTPERAVALAVENECPGIAFTYNEPIIQLEYVIDVATAAHEAGLFTIMVTNGYVTQEALDLLGGLIDVWRVDIKGSTTDEYRRLCRISDPGPIRRMAVRAATRWGMHVEVVTNVVPTVNDSEESLRATARWIASELGPLTPWHVTRFFPYLELSDLEPTPVATLQRARRIGTEEGLRFVYLGNVGGEGGEDTVCPGCGRVAIRRAGYAVSRIRVKDGSCDVCGEPLGVVDRWHGTSAHGVEGR